MRMNSYVISDTANPYHGEFLKWNNPPYIFGTVHYHFRDIKTRTLLVSQSDYTNMLAGLALYWWQRLITFGFGRIRVNYTRKIVFI